MTKNVRMPFFAFLASTLCAQLALAGPPLICHPIQIGTETSLPWAGGSNWNSPSPGYDVRNLTADTLKLLVPGKPVIARMETLRRAAIYSSKSPESTLDLAARLMGRALDSGKDSLAVFDAGYFIESVRQMGITTKTNPLAGLNGYDWIRNSAAASMSDPTIDYALALMREGPWPNDHYRKAVAGAKNGSLLAQNLVAQSNQRSLDGLKSSLGKN